MYDTNQSLINVNGNQVPTLDILLMMTIVSLLPSLLIMVTSFVRTVIILSFLRNAMGVQQTPPNMVLVGIAIFLTLFIMDPVIKEINTEAYTPYKNQEITQEEAISRAQVPLKEFMLRNTEKSSLNMFIDLSGREDIEIENQEQLIELPMTVIIPSFMTSELKKGFTAGFLLYLPFLLIDIVVSSTLMSMGMMMLPPAMISMPFKLLLFVTVDGWELLFSTIAGSFH
ncbi:MAG: flagellar type III secretion system pore protein FliP [Lachnospiraceae bacterium]